MQINISHLNKNYGSKVALNDVSLQINDGMFGLLGPNGAGKTTLMRILTALIPKTCGEVTINNIDILHQHEIRKIIGYLPQDFSMYPSITVYEAMDYLGLLSGINDNNKRKKLIKHLLHKVNLEKDQRKKVRALSGGMRRRLGIAQAILNNPQVLIVDEPTAGLDPEERIRFRNLLRDFSDNRIVILSTHIVEDIEFTCENLAILNKGRLLYTGKVQDLIEKAKDKIWTVLVDRDQIDKIRTEFTILSTVSEEDKVRVRILSQDKPFNDAIISNPNIEDAYMSIMKFQKETA